MTGTEALMLVRLVRAMCPQQKLDEYTPDAWAMVLDDLRFEDCRQAIKNLGARQVFIAPSEIRTEVRRIRRDRLDRTLLPIPPFDLTPLQTLEWQRRVTRQIADGTYRPSELERSRPMPRIEHIFRTIEGDS